MKHLSLALYCLPIVVPWWVSAATNGTPLEVAERGMTMEYHNWYITTQVVNSVPGVSLVHVGCEYDSPDVSMWSIPDLNKAIENHMREWHNA